MKIYAKPETKIVELKITQALMSTSSVSNSYSSSTQLSRENNSWDIWGNEDEE